MPKTAVFNFYFALLDAVNLVRQRASWNFRLMLSLKLYFLLSIASLFCVAHAEPNTVPAKVFGKYKSINKVCFAGQADEKNEIIWQDCSLKTDTLNISRTIEAENAHYFPAQVQLELHFTNAHQCVFDGKASWRQDRLITYSEDNVDCEIAIFFFDGAAHISASKQCRSYCGERGVIDGAILRK